MVPGRDDIGGRRRVGLIPVRVIKGYPPNYVEIRRCFPSVAGRRDVLFAYGDTIYQPGGKILTDALRAHEEVHSAQQDGDPAGWWQKYMADPAFRLDQEVPAHRAEYRVLLAQGAKQDSLDFVVRRLASGLYGHGITLQRARELVES